MYTVANYKRMQFQCHFLNVNWVEEEKWKLNQLCKKSICVKWKSETWDVYFFYVNVNENVESRGIFIR